MSESDPDMVHPDQGLSMEQHLCKVTGIDKNKYTKRQDLLAALLRSIEKLPDGIYDGIREDAFQWYKQGVTHHNNRKAIPEFPDQALDELNGLPLQTSLEELSNPEEVQSGEGAGATPMARANKRQLPPRRIPDYENLTGEKDRFGITIGTNTHEAVKMYEKGCTARDVEQALGGRYRNVLRKLADDGHIVEKLGAGVYKVTHKDDAHK